MGGGPRVQGRHWGDGPGVAGSWLEDQAQGEFGSEAVLPGKAWRDESHLAWGWRRRAEGTIRGSAASASDHLHLGPGRGLRRRGTGVRARGGRGWGSGLGLPASHTTHARNTDEHLDPQSTHMCLCVHTYTQLGKHLHTHVSLSPVTLTHVLQGHTSSHTCPHGNGKRQKRAGWGRAGEGAALPQGHVAEADPSIQLPDAEAPARPPGLAAGVRSTGPARRTVARMERVLTTCQAQC